MEPYLPFALLLSLLGSYAVHGIEFFDKNEQQIM